MIWARSPAPCDLQGNTLERYSYDLYGRPTILFPDGVNVRSSSSLGLKPVFLGRPYETDANIYDFRSRFYDPDLFIFLQPDQILFADGWNPYAFTQYNPINYRDPFGRFIWFAVLLLAVIGAAIGGISAYLNGGDCWDILAGVGVEQSEVLSQDLLVIRQ